MNPKIIELSKNCSFESASILAFISVETGGIGFSKETGKLIIQFEPSWFRKKQPFAPSGAWSCNGVDVQSKEWEAFNNAFSINQTSAMESTSIGLGQIMGFHWKRLGYKNVDEMWNDAKLGLEQQFNQLIKFIETDNRLLNAIKNKDWHLVATYYNGSGYKKLAEKIGREPYNISLEKAYNKYKALQC